MRRNATLALAAVVLVLAFWKLRLTDPATQYTVSGSDFFVQLYPMWLRAAAWMRAGALPLWNPYQMCGHPFLASVLYGIFYPPNLVRLFVPAEIAIEVNLVFHLWLAVVFMAVYGRSIGLKPLSACLAGVAYGLGGGAASEAIWFTATIASMVWLPLGLAAVEHLFRRGAWLRRWTAVLALAVAMPILAGWLQTWLYNAYVICAYAACHAAARAWRGRSMAARGSLLVAAGVGLGIAIGAAQLLPSMELQALGPRRPGGLSLQQTLPMGAFPPEFFVRGIVDAQPGLPRATYAGIVTLLLLPLAFALPRQRLRAAFLTAMAVASLLIAFSVYTPVFGWYRLLPGATWFRGPSRILCLFSFAMAALGGLGLDALLRLPRRRRWLVAPLVGAAALVLVLADVPVLAKIYAGAGALLLFVGVFTERSGGRGALAAAVACLLCVDLFAASANPQVRPFQSMGLFEDERDVFDYIAQHQGLDRTYVSDLFPGAPGLMNKQGTLRRVYAVSDYEGLILSRTATFFRALSGRFQNPSDQIAPFTGTLRLDALRLKQLDVMSVRFIVLRREDGLKGSLEAEGWQRVLEAGDQSSLVYENPRVLPRAYVAHTTQVAPNADMALTLMLRGVFDPWKFAVLEGEGGVLPEARPVMPITAATITGYEPTRVEIDTDAAAPGYLVLSDTYYPGWQAKVDGETAPIYRANYLFRAVAVPAGRHRVSFAYRPTSVAVGAAVSLLASAVVLLLLVWRDKPALV